jgi:4-amino-4-deoxy-L-arabinose transferase-like glycosyltransferase
MVRFLKLNPRYLGSYVGMMYGLGMAVSGHVRPTVTMASGGALLLYGAVLYHARKRQRFGSNKVWLALEIYAGLSAAWMAVNILRTQVWQWHPLAFGLMPLVVVGAYLVALIGKPSMDRKTETVPSSGSSAKQIPLVITVAVVWAILNIYAFPKFGFVT